MTAKKQSGGYPAILSAVWLLAAASGVMLVACDKQETKANSPIDEAPPSNVSVPVSSTLEPPVTKPAEIDEPEIIETPEVVEVETPEVEVVDESSEFVYVDEMTGEERNLPVEFKNYPEWGLFQYSDQVVRHNREQMNLHAGDPAKVKEFSEKIDEFTAKKTEAYQAMEQRKAEPVAE